MKNRVIGGLTALTLVTSVGLLALPSTAGAAVTQNQTCTDGGGNVWQGQAIWADAPYTGADGLQHIANDQTGFRSTDPDATTVDYTVKSYNGDGTLLQTLEGVNEAYNPTTAPWRYRNPVNPVSAPGQAKVVLNIGDGNDGFGNCTMTFVQPGTAPSPSPTPSPSNPATPGSVTANGQTRNLDGVNIPRDANAFVLYNTVGQTVPTNQYGAEAVVVNGVVTQLLHRNATGGAAPVVPANGYVISGHGTGGTYAGDWVLANLTVGKTVTLGGVSNPTTSPTPSTPPTTQPPAGNDANMSLWHHRWEGPNLRDYPQSVKDNLDRVVLGLAQSAGNGAISYDQSNGQSQADHAADIRAFEAAGIDVLLGFGGSSDTTTITNTTQADNFAASVVALQRTYGFTGVDVDLEPSGTSWSVSALAYGLRKAETQVEAANPGMEFKIGVTPGLYAPHTTKWFELSDALGADMDYMAPMLYDFPEANDSRLTAVSVQKVQEMNNAGIPDSKIVLGYAHDTYANASPPNSDNVKNAFAEAERLNPGIGAFLWEDKLQRNQGWVGFNKLAPLVNG